ncbi:MAG: bacteriophage abortive infection AbiH family protein [Bacteroides cellulosilyticus]|nr:bacteriophage abortive infection AbiH family protein [Bacteroides cellulosilyticus]
MMNRIILIGNGFDLAHGLKTSYKDFIEDYWSAWVKTLTESSRQMEEDGLCSFQLKIAPDYYRSASTIKQFIGAYSNNSLSANCLAEISQLNENSYNDKIYHRYISRFFKTINKAIESKKWVDVEYEYYRMLKQIVDDKTGKPYSTPIELDKEFEAIKTKLIEYLDNIQKAEIAPTLVKNCIRKTVYESFSINDISNQGQSIFREFIVNRWNAAQQENKSERKIFAHKYGYSMGDKEYELKEYIRLVSDFSGHWNNIQNGPYTTPDYFLLPDQILFLNFNYTSTADLYIPKGSEFKVNHIHGKLDNKDKIIFGYGDELDEDYKKISNLNDNNYLSNIKSIRYLETDNYRKLLSFIDSAPFQIYIMGHSCGNSDRTLLNTLFEHKNCVSIKPFYYEKFDEDGNRCDNYIEIIQNISRNFNDMRLMRDRVVNKTYCRPLVPKGAEQ